MDTRKLVLFFIFAFSVLMLADAWTKAQRPPTVATSGAEGAPATAAKGADAPAVPVPGAPAIAVPKPPAAAIAARPYPFAKP